MSDLPNKSRFTDRRVDEFGLSNSVEPRKHLPKGPRVARANRARNATSAAGQRVTTPRNRVPRLPFEDPPSLYGDQMSQGRKQHKLLDSRRAGPPTFDTDGIDARHLSKIRRSRQKSVKGWTRLMNETLEGIHKRYDREMDGYIRRASIGNTRDVDEYTQNADEFRPATASRVNTQTPQLGPQGDASAQAQASAIDQLFNTATYEVQPNLYGAVQDARPTMYGRGSTTTLGQSITSTGPLLTFGLGGQPDAQGGQAAQYGHGPHFDFEGGWQADLDGQQVDAHGQQAGASGDWQQANVYW